MDLPEFVEKAKKIGKKYMFPALILLFGIILMTLPSKDKQEEEPTAEEETKPAENLQNDLEDILCFIQGAGKVKVLLTEAAGELTVYQADENSQAGNGSESIRRETVLLTDADRNESGLVRQVNPPIYQGAVVLCQGADSAAVRLAIIQAVTSATGLTTDKVTVLKMK